MPARKKPVKKRKLSRLIEWMPSMVMARLKIAAITELTKKTKEGEKRSEIANTAKTNVPVIKPTCTALVRCAKKFRWR